MNIIEDIRDPQLFRPYLADKSDSLATWSSWLTCLRVIYGLPLKTESQRRLVQQCTGRNPDKLNPNGYDTVLLLVGRRGGKSKIAGLIGGFEASLSGRERLCSPGELPMVSICAPSKDQSQIILSYSRAALGSPMLDEAVTDDIRGQFRLSNGVTVRVLTGTFKAVRSYTQIAVIVDEVCFFNSSEESKCSDTELIRSIKPALLTTHGKLVCVSTKYAPRGWGYSTWKKHFGNDSSRILVWDASSRTMNPCLSQEDIDAEIAEDPVGATCEFENSWREDVQDYLPRSVVEACVVKDRTELLPRSGIEYRSFVDVSGGRKDPMALCIGHKEGSRKIVIDFLKLWKPPCNPLVVIADMADELKRYHLRTTCGDAYAAEFNVAAFRNNGIAYVKSDKNKSELYLELIGPIVAQEVDLPDREDLVAQIASLERRTRSGGRDSVDHPSGGHDDLANVIAGVCVGASKGRFVPGFITLDGDGSGSVMSRRLFWGRLAQMQRGGY
jgi:hypothetical protein